MSEHIKNLKETVLKTKQCSKCKRRKSVDDFRTDSSTRTGYKSQCKQCQNDYGFEKRQRNLKERMATEPNIKQCECGNYFNSTVKGRVQMEPLTRCQECAKSEPLVKVYVAELKKCVWVKIPVSALRKK